MNGARMEAAKRALLVFLQSLPVRFETHIAPSIDVFCSHLVVADHVAFQHD